MNVVVFDAFGTLITYAGLRRYHALGDAKANMLGWIASGRDVATILRQVAQ